MNVYSLDFPMTGKVIKKSEEKTVITLVHSVVYPNEERRTISFVYKNIYSFIRNIVMVVCMVERQRIAMMDTTWKQIYLEAYFFLLLWREFLYGASPLLGDHLASLQDDLSNRWLLDWPPDFQGSKNLCIIYFLDANSFSFPLNSRDSFPLSLFHP